MTTTRTKVKKKSLSFKTVLVIYFLILLGAVAAFAGIKPLLAVDNSRLVTIFTEDGFVEVTTDKTFVWEIIEEAEIVLDEQLERTVPELDQELEADFIVIERASVVVIKFDGQELEVITWAQTIQDVLLEQNITLQEEDLINIPFNEMLATGQEIEIVRVETEFLYEEVVLTATTSYRNDPSLTVGTEKIHTQPKDGKKKLTYEVVYNDGVEITRTKVKEEVVTEPVVGLVLRGTQVVVSRGTSRESTSTPPRTTNAVEGIASYYGAELHGNNTASGVPFDMNALTAAHNTLAFGTRVRVTYLTTGKSVVVVINDRGPHVPGRIIDLSYAAAKQIGLSSAGIGTVRVEILD